MITQRDIMHCINTRWAQGDKYPLNNYPLNFYAVGVGGILCSGGGWVKTQPAPKDQHSKANSTNFYSKGIFGTPTIFQFRPIFSHEKM